LTNNVKSKLINLLNEADGFYMHAVISLIVAQSPCLDYLTHPAMIRVYPLRTTETNNLNNETTPTKT
jgi:hypothetical protein